jgi:glycosyltransferase involved in cell wall biosynthesis
MSELSSRDGRRLRVLWLVKGFATGGVERLVYALALAIDRQRFDCHVAYVLPYLNDLDQPLREAGVPVHCLDAANGLDPRWLLRLDDLIRRYQFDVIHIHSPFVAGFARPLVRMRRHRPALVFTEHNVWWGYHPLTTLVNSTLYRWDDARFAVSRQVRDSVWKPCRGGRSEIEVLVHGLRRDDVDTVVDTSAVRAELGIPPDRVIVTAVGNLRAQKGYEVLLHAARRVVDANPQVTFVVVGGHGDRRGLERLRDDLQLQKAVVFAGHHDEVTPILKASDIYTLSSHFEGGPLSLIEAMDAGLPAVATRVGFVPDLVRDGVEGYVVPPKRSDLLAEGVVRLAADPQQRSRMAAAARERVQDFRFEDAVGRIEEVYADLRSRILANRL